MELSELLSGDLMTAFFDAVFKLVETHTENHHVCVLRTASMEETYKLISMNFKNPKVMRFLEHVIKNTIKIPLERMHYNKKACSCLIDVDNMHFEQNPQELKITCLDAVTLDDFYQAYTQNLDITRKTISILVISECDTITYSCDSHQVYRAGPGRELESQELYDLVSCQEDLKKDPAIVLKEQLEALQIASNNKRTSSLREIFFSDRKCWFCNKADSIVDCPRCSCACYCGEACLSKDKTRHKRHCNIISSMKQGLYKDLAKNV
jgi:hypothetical protein